MNITASNQLTLNQNLVGSRSTLYLGYFNSSLPTIPYTLFTNLSDQLLQPVFTFQITDLKIGNYSFPGTQKQFVGDVPTVTTVIGNTLPYVLIQTSNASAVGAVFYNAISLTLPGSMTRFTDNSSNIVQVYIPEIDCADVAINSAALAIQFTTLNNYQYTMNQALFRQDGDDCALMVLFSFNATRDLVIFGLPAMHNLNLTIDYDRGLIGLSNGVNLTQVIINYLPRDALLVVVFLVIAAIGGCISYSISSAKKKHDALIEDKRHSNEVAENLEE